jgi:hypothetical protein
MNLHKTTFQNLTDRQKKDKCNEVYFKAVQLAAAGNFEVVFQAKSSVVKSIIDPRIFYFREDNFDNLMDIRGLVGKELTKRIQQKPFNDFKLSFGASTPPSCEQRGYYWGVVIPTIQEHFKAKGNYMKEDELHEAIKNCIESEEGLTCEKVNPITGEFYQSQITISNAGNKAEVVKYIDAVIRWAAGYGVHIPESDNLKEK